MPAEPRQRTRSGKFAKVRTHYEVTVWNQTNGNVEKYLPDATEAELQEVRDHFSDEPWCEGGGRE